MGSQALIILITINAGTFITSVIGVIRFIRFINDIEFKTDLMWQDYTHRIGYTHKRSTDKHHG